MKQRGRFFQVDERIFDYGLTPFQFIVYCYLVSCAGSAAGAVIRRCARSQKSARARKALRGTRSKHSPRWGSSARNTVTGKTATASGSRPATSITSSRSHSITRKGSRDMTGTGNCRSERLCAPVCGGQSSDSIPTPPGHFDGVSTAFEAISAEKTQSRIKNRRRARAGSPDFCPQCGQSGHFSPGVKAGEEKSACGHSVVCSAEKQKNPRGLLPRKETQ